MRPIQAMIFGSLSVFATTLFVCCPTTPGQSSSRQAAARSTGLGKTVQAKTQNSWPTDMLLVGVEGQAATVPMGISSKDAVKWATFFSPHNRRLALMALKNTSSELGEADLKVEPFFMSRYAVTNEQYLRYIKISGARFPFHWWKNGATDDYKEHRPKIYKAFPDLQADDRINAPLYYWEDFWKSNELKYSIPKGQEKYPVIFVSWRDAMQYAAWAGMRLPTEREWTFAANGGTRKTFVFGDDWGEKILDELKLSNFRDTVLKPVGALGPLARGPFGHGDMVGQVWEWVRPLGFEPQTSKVLFKKEYSKLRKNKKFGGSFNESIAWYPDYAVAKGGSFFSFSTKDFVQARINCRAKLDTKQTMAGLGFRVAKSKRPAYDMSLSRLKSSYPSYISESKAPNYADQIGWERYHLEGAGDIIAKYEALSILPISYLSFKKSPRARKLGENSMKRPYEMAFMISTEALVSPALSAGTYVIYFRKAGIPQELQDALSAAYKVLLAAKKARDRAELAKAKAAKSKKPGKPKKSAKKNKKKKPSKERDQKWRQIVMRYGYSDEEILANGPKECAKYVYLRHVGIKDDKAQKTFKLSTEQNQLIFRDNSGKWIVAVPTKESLAKINSDDTPSAVTDPVGGSMKFSFSVPIDQVQMVKKRSRRQITIKLDLQMK